MLQPYAIVGSSFILIGPSLNFIEKKISGSSFLDGKQITPSCMANLYALTLSRLPLDIGILSLGLGVILILQRCLASVV